MVRLSFTLSAYIGRQFLFWFASIFFGLLAVVVMFDTVELMRRAAAREEATLGVVIEMAFTKLPMMAQELLPFAVLFGGMFTFWRMTRNQELVVARGAGVSVWQFLLPAIVIALLLGIFKVAMFNPFASVMALRFEHLESKYLRGQSSLLSVSSTGLWLRQTNENGQSIVHASRILPDRTELQDVIIFLFDETDRFTGRIDADSGQLTSGYWHLREAWLTGPDQPAKFHSEYRMETDLTLGKIQDSFAPPETMSFWELPEFIGILERAGFSAVKHRIHWNSLLASPLLLAAMVLIAASFSLRLTRRGGTLLMVLGGIGTGFMLYFLTDLVFALGRSGNIPVALAAWTPAGISILLGLSLLLHLEDG